MLNLNKSLPAIAAAAIGFLAGAWLFAGLLAEPKPASPAGVVNKTETEPVKKAEKPQTDSARLADDQG